MTNEIPQGRAKGGYARAARLSQDQRSAIASEAARARWKDHGLPDVPRVLEGFKSELHLAGVTIPCALISGPKGIQRVLTENGITYAILGERSAGGFRDGMGHVDMSYFRMLGNWGFTWIVRLLYGGSFSDLCYGYVAFDISGMVRQQGPQY